jgi:SPP1 gp7 family putative phage head morphogenesis protein
MPTTSLSANAQLQSLGVDHLIGLRRLEDTIVRDITKLLDEVQKDILKKLEARLSRALAKGVDPGPWSTARLNNLLVDIKAVNAEAYKAIGKQLTTDLGKAAQYEAAWQAQTMEKVLPIRWAATKPSAELLQSIVKDLPLAGKTMVQEVSKQAANQLAAVRSQVAIGMAQGETVEQMVQRVAGAPRAIPPRPGVLKISKARAETLVRTSVNHTTTSARQATYAANQDVLKGYQYVATLDARTTLICASLDGSVHQFGKGPLPPQHWNCRSTTVPVVKSWAEMGLDGEETDLWMRESLDGKVPAKLSFNDWIRGKQASDPAFFDNYFGKYAATMRANPSLKVGDLLNSVRQPLTIAQLASIEAVAVPNVVTAAQTATTVSEAELTKIADALKVQFEKEAAKAAKRAKKLAGLNAEQQAALKKSIKKLQKTRMQGLESTAKSRAIKDPGVKALRKQAQEARAKAVIEPTKANQALADKLTAEAKAAELKFAKAIVDAERAERLARAAAQAEKAFLETAAKQAKEAKKLYHLTESRIIRAPGTDEAFVQEIIKEFNSLPRHVRKNLLDRRYKFRVGETMTEASPRLKGLHPRGHPPGATFDGIEGCHMGGYNEFVLSRGYLSNYGNGSTWTASQRVKSVFHHEIGHGFDRGTSIRWSESSKRLISAHTKDLQNMAGRSNVKYYIQQQAGDSLTLSTQAGRSETVAETIGEILSGDLTAANAEKLLMWKKFPNSFRVISKSYKLATPEYLTPHAVSAIEGTAYNYGITYRTAANVMNKVHSVGQGDVIAQVNAGFTQASKTYGGAAGIDKEIARRLGVSTQKGIDLFLKGETAYTKAAEAVMEDILAEAVAAIF